MNTFPPPLSQCAAEVENPALRALRSALDRAKEHRRYELENFNAGLLAHARCIDMYDSEIKTLTNAIAMIDPHAAGEAAGCAMTAEAAKDYARLNR